MKVYAEVLESKAAGERDPGVASLLDHLEKQDLACVTACSPARHSYAPQDTSLLEAQHARQDVCEPPSTTERGIHSFSYRGERLCAVR